MPQESLRKLLAVTIILFASFSCLFFTNAAFAENANVSGVWNFSINFSPPMNIHSVDTYVCSSGKQTVITNDYITIELPFYPMNITQGSDGSLSGNYNYASGTYSRSQVLTGTVTGNSVNFRLIINYKDDGGGEKFTSTDTCDFSGSVSGGNLSGTLNVSHLYQSEWSFYGAGCDDGAKVTRYRKATGSTTTPLSFKLPNNFDTIITSHPDTQTTPRRATFSYTGVNGKGGGIAGYYYQLDTSPKVYTTQTTVTFPKLSLGRHTFSVAAKDKQGNIDPTPASYSFTIIDPPPPNPTEGSQRGQSQDPNKETGDPINVITGNMYVYTSDLKFPGKGFDFDFSRTYNSRDSYSGPLGYGWTHSYNIFLTADSANNLIKIKDSQGREILFKDNTYGGLIPQRGEYSTLTKNATGYIWRLKNGTQFYFNTAGKLTKIVDRNANPLTFTYSANQLTKITDAASRKVTIAYDTSGRIISLTNPLGKIYKYAYDGSNNLISVADPLNNETTYAYAANHNLIKKTLPNGRVITFTYDSYDRCTSSSGENDYEKVILSFEPQASRTSVKNSKNNQTIYYYSSDYQITEIIDSLGNHTKSSWDNNLNLTSRTNALNYTVNMEYDAKGNLVKITDPLYNITTFTYEPTFNNLTSVTDALGNVTKYFYDSKGNLIKAINASNVATTYQYASGGLLSSITNAYGKTIYFTYDAYANISSIKDLAGITVKFAYDIMGNKITSTDPRANVTRYYYDSLNRLIKILLADKVSTNLFTYDALDNLTSSTNALNYKTTYTYNALGKIETITDALGGIITNTYDSEGNLISLKDQNNNLTTYSYDDLNRLISKTDAANYKWQYFYDAVSNCVKEIDPKGQTITYVYDELNYLKNLNAPDTNVSFTYDSLGRIISLTDWQGIINYTYDAIGQLLSVNGPASNNIIKYSYDLLGNRKTMLDYDNKLTKYTYDGANRLLTITDPQNLLTKYSYDTYGNLSSLLYPNSTGTIYKYDSLNRLAKLINQQSFKPYTKFSEYTYTYDALNRKTSVKVLDNTINYAYDALGRLIQETNFSTVNYNQITYTYDKAGNRLSKNHNTFLTNYTYNQLNQLTQATTAGSYPSSDTYFYAYDNNGNLVSKTRGPDQTVLTYDSLNRLIELARGYFNNYDVYKYDAAGNRIQLRSLSSMELTNYLYDGKDVILEKDSSQTTTKTYLRNPYTPGGIAGIISLKSQSAGNQYFHYDAQGSLTGITSQSAGILNSYTYDSFGNMTAKPSKSTTTRRFLTKEQDESGLIYFGQRYYDPSIGRFITPDPSGMVDGPNLYLYCNNDPINFVDLWGLCGEKSWWDKSLTDAWRDIWKELTRPVTPEELDQMITNMTIGFSGGIKFVGKGGPIVLGRFRLGNQRGISVLRELAERYNARILDQSFPKGVTLEQGIKAEIDAASKIYLRMKGVKPGYVSYDIEYLYIKSKEILKNKTKFLWEK
jgi:RHS repeat-associated protein